MSRFPICKSFAPAESTHPPPAGGNCGKRKYGKTTPAAKCQSAPVRPRFRPRWLPHPRPSRFSAENAQPQHVRTDSARARLRGLLTGADIARGLGLGPKQLREHLLPILASCCLPFSAPADDGGPEVRRCLRQHCSPWRGAVWVSLNMTIHGNFLQRGEGPSFAGKRSSPLFPSGGVSTSASSNQTRPRPEGGVKNVPGFICGSLQDP